MPLACRVQWSCSWVDRTGDTVKQSQRRVTSPTVIEACLLTTRSKMFRQHLKCSLTAPRGAGTSSGFFCFFLLSQLSEPGRLGTALSGPASRLASAMTFSGCDTAPTVDCCLFSICWTQSPEELGRVSEHSLEWTDCRAATLTFFFFLMLTRRRRGLGERRDRILHRRHSTHYDACRRETAWVFPAGQRYSEVRAGRLSGRFRLRAYRTVQIRPVSSIEAYTTGFSQTSILKPSPFSGRTNGAQWRQGESKFLPCFLKLEHNVVSQNVFHGLQKGQIHPRKH